MAEEQEQNRSEAPTPFKLRRARERGIVARSTELGFLGALAGLALFGAIAGTALVEKMAQAMRLAFTAGIDRADDPAGLPALLGSLFGEALAPLLLLGGTVAAVILFLEILQLRGLIFTAQPLKPDFSRLNPAKGLKRIFSMRMLKETLKTVLKTAVYGIAAWLVLRDAAARYALVANDGERLAETMAAAGLRLLLVFAAIALFFVALDQIIVRGEFLKQMRMSRRELTRESKDREGDPRIKAKRKKLHAEFARQSQGAKDLPGSDLLIVNPEHFAVALRYDPARMAAPAVSARGRNRFALALRDEAARLGIPVIARPELARALYRSCEAGSEIPAAQYQAVAELYILLKQRATGPETNA